MKYSPLQDRRTFTQIGNFGLKIFHLAALERKAVDLRRRKKQIGGLIAGGRATDSNRIFPRFFPQK
jgi:hypothetical protein